MLILSNGLLKSELDDNKMFYFDAIVFKGEELGKARLDIYVSIPYQSLRFNNVQGTFISKFDVQITVFDSTNSKVFSDKITKQIVEENYYIAQGGEGDMKVIQEILLIAPGKYKIIVNLNDKIDNNNSERKRQISVIDFNKYEFSLSGLMLLSSIEERGENYVITPYISDNIAKLDDGFFAFFEAYSLNYLDSVDFIFEVLDEDKKSIYNSGKIRKKIANSTRQIYHYIPNDVIIHHGKYQLNIEAHKAVNDSITDPIAITQRSLRFNRTIDGLILSDINLAARQLRWIASPDEFDFIQSAKTEKEKRYRFDDFWNSKDPTPSTIRNEAFEEYFRRVQYADEKFKSYSDGWLSDMGMVFIIFGPPNQIEDSGYGMNRQRYQKWIYYNNREFLFLDNSGIGDFRLVQPYSVYEKYEYRN